MQRGIFITIDGIDGSGKKTQADLLVSHLRKEGYAVELADFPQYGHKSAGAVEEYLNGVYGSAEEIGPYRASILFAVDRYAASAKIRAWLAEGKIVISNRYVSANMGHQGSRMHTREERQKFFTWLTDLEYGLFKIPKPDITLILHVSAATAQRLVDLKSQRAYLASEKKRDILENDLSHLKQAEDTYLEMVQLFPEYTLIECEEHSTIAPIEIIAEKIWNVVAAKLL